MNGYAITVDFTLTPGSRPAFRRLVDQNARASCSKEPGCRRFDVLEAATDENRILLYEIYDSRAAFEEHLRTSHFASFDRESAPLIQRKSVAEFSLVCEGSQPGEN